MDTVKRITGKYPHEMNGVWFWWGDKKDSDGYQKLWKMMYDR
jgi:mannan endo-1,4-beta-mannosidase